MVKDVRLEINQTTVCHRSSRNRRPAPPQLMKSNLNTTVKHEVMLAGQQVLCKPIRIEFHKTPDLPEESAIAIRFARWS